MTAREIRGHLLINGYRVSDVARELKVGASAVSQSISGGPCFSWRIREFIAEKIGKPVEAIWAAIRFTSNRIEGTGFPRIARGRRNTNSTTPRHKPYIVSIPKGITATSKASSTP